jgi:hypothetical protein
VSIGEFLECIRVRKYFAVLQATNFSLAESGDIPLPEATVFTDFRIATPY